MQKNNQIYNNQMSLESVVHENMKEYTRFLKKGSSISGICIGLGFVLFAIGGFTAVASMNFGLMGIVPVGFIMFAGGAICTGYFSAHYMSAKTLCSYIDYILTMDYVTVKEAAEYMGNNIASTVHILNGLLRTNNLPGYEMIENKIVAKKELHLDLDDLKFDAKSPYDVLISKAKNKVRICPNCGSTLRKSDEHCEYCGK